MKNFRRFFSQNTEKFILFVAGVIVSSVISSLLEGFIAWSELFLVIATILVIIAAIFFFSETSHRVQELADKVETTVYYVEEPYREQEGIQFKGVTYLELKRIIGDAKREILTLTTLSIDDGKGRITDTHSSRVDYFRMLEQNIEQHQASGFKYVRIQQVPRDAENLPVSRFVNTETANHYRRIIELERRLKNEKLNISIMKMPTQRITSFIIIDRRHIILGVDGIDVDNRPYTAGMFVFDDKGGNMVERFIRYFENLERLANPVTLAEIESNK